jgi:hypothetical protein
MIEKPERYWDFEPPVLPTGAASEEDGQLQQGGHVGAWQMPATASMPHAAVAAAHPVPPPQLQRGFRPYLLRILVPLLVIVLLGVAGSVQVFQFSALVKHRGREGVSQTAIVRQHPTVPPMGTPSATTTAPGTTTPTAQSSPQPQPTILAQDDFQRPNQLFWGMASDGSTWEGNANTAAAFSIVNGSGMVTDGQGFFNAILGPLVANEEVVFSSKISRFNGGNDNLGAVLRWTDKSNYYKSYLDGFNLILIKRVAGVSIRLGAIPFAAHNDISYTLRFRAVGVQFFARAWQTGTTEPATWMVTANDTALPSGFGGIRVLLQDGIVVTVTAIQEKSIV